MIKITPYISNNYNTPEQAQRAATCLSKMDGNKYVVYCEVVSGNSTFYFDNTDEVSSRYSDPKQTFTVRDALEYSGKNPEGIQTVAELIEFITTNRKPILDFVTPSERISTMKTAPSFQE